MWCCIVAAIQSVSADWNWYYVPDFRLERTWIYIWIAGRPVPEIPLELIFYGWFWPLLALRNVVADTYLAVLSPGDANGRSYSNTQKLGRPISIDLRFQFLAFLVGAQRNHRGKVPIIGGSLKNTSRAYWKGESLAGERRANRNFILNLLRGWKHGVRLRRNIFLWFG